MSVSRESRVRVRAAIVLALVFGGGVTIGFALDRGVAQASPERQPRAEAPREEAPPPNGWIIDRLEMTVEQRTRVDSVVDHFGRHMTDLQKAYQPRFQAVVDSTNLALRALLDEAQRAQYDSLEAELQRRRGRNPPGRR